MLWKYTWSFEDQIYYVVTKSWYIIKLCIRKMMHKFPQCNRKGQNSHWGVIILIGDIVTPFGRLR